MRIGITGASGLLGGALRDLLSGSDHACTPLRLPRDDSLRERDWPEAWPDPESFDLLIHSAASLRPTTPSELYLNARLPSRLESAFHRRNPRGTFIHVSSINVLIEDLGDPYTTSKRAAETAVDLRRTVIVRPSLIWSEPDRGPAGRLRDFLLKTPLSFMTYPGNRHLPVRVEDLARAIMAIGESGRPCGVINIHGDRPYTLWQLAKEVAHRHRRRLLPIPAPFTSSRLPRLLRSIDYTRLSTTWRPCADETILLPFQLGGNPTVRPPAVGSDGGSVGHGIPNGVTPG